MTIFADIPLPPLEQEKKKEPSPVLKDYPFSKDIPPAEELYIFETLKGTEFENDYLNVSKALLKEGTSGFDFAVHLDQGNLKRSLELFKGISPEIAAKVQRISKERGAAFPTSVNTIDDLLAWDKAHKIFLSLFEKDENGKLKYPYTAQWISNPENMAIAKDDTETLRIIEGMLNQFKPLPARMTKFFTEALKAGQKSMLITAQDINEVIGPLMKYLPQKAINVLPTGAREIATIQKQPGGTEFISKNIQSIKDIEFLQPIPLKRSEIWWERYFEDVAANMPQIVQGLAISTLTGGAPFIGALSMGARIYGSKKEELIKRGVDEKRARIAALGHATAETILEWGALYQWMEMFGAPRNIKEIGIRAARTFAAEWLQEFFQEHADVISTIWAEAEKEGHTPEDQIRIFWETWPETIKQGAYAGTIAAPMVLFGAVTRLPFDFMHINNLNFNTQFWNKINSPEIAKAPIIDKAPLQVKKFIDDAAKATKGRDTFFVSLDAVQTLFQDDPKGYDKFLNDLNLKSQLDEAQNTGKELEIKISDWITKKYAGTDISLSLDPDIRFDPQGITKREGSRLNEEIREAIKEQEAYYQKNIEQNRLPKQFIEMRNKMITPRGEGGFGLKPDDADAELKVFLAGATVLSRKAGETLQQWFDRINPSLQVGGEYVGGEIKKEYFQKTGKIPKFIDKFFKKKEEVFQKPGEKPRGSVSFEDSRTLINLYRNADMSTFIHETGHIFYNEMRKLVESGKADSQLQKDFLSLSNFAFKGQVPPPSSITPQKPRVERADLRETADKLEKFPIDDYSLTSTIYDEISAGQAGFRKKITEMTERGEEERYEAIPSTFPEYFKNKGYTKKETLKILQKVLNGKKLAEKQQEIYDDLLESKKREIVEQSLKMRIPLEEIFEEKKEEIIPETTTEPTGEVDTSFDFGANIKEQFQGKIPSDKDIDFEKIAKAFELYVKEGKAPSPELVQAFRKFKNWLSAIYRVFREYYDDVEINDEVRGIFDRLLASEDEINAVIEYYKQRKKLEDYVELDDKEKQALEAKRKMSKDAAIEKQVSRYLKAYLKAVGQTKEIANRVSDEIDNLPVYKAMDEARESGGISFNELSMTYGMQIAQELSGKHKGLVSKTGLASLHDIASKYGYESIDELISAFQKAEEKKTAKKLRTKQIINQIETEIREDLTKDEEIPGEETLHTDENLSTLIAEAQLLADKASKAEKIRLGIRKFTAQAFKDAAENILMGKTVRQATRYDFYAKSEKKFTDQVFKHLENGDTVEAAIAKEKQALNHALVQIAIKNRDLKHRIELGAKRLGKLNPEKYEFANREAILALLQRYGLGTPTMRPQKPGEVNLISLMNNMEEIGLPAVIPDWILNMQGPENYRDLKFAELLQLYDAMRNIKAWGDKTTVKMISDIVKEITGIEKDMTIDGIVELAVESMLKLKSRLPFELGHPLHYLQKFKRWTISTIGLGPLFTQELDGYKAFGPEGKPGLNQMLFLRGFASADSKEKHFWDTKIKPRLLGQGDIIQGLKAINNRIKKEYGKTFNIPDLPMGVNETIIQKLAHLGKSKWTAEKLIIAALHMGTEKNLGALSRGYGWNDKHIKIIQGIFTESEWRTIQSIWDMINEFYPLMDEVFFRINDTHSPKELAVPFDVITSDGKAITLRGGYFPLIYDNNLSFKAAKYQEEDLMKNRAQAIYHSVNPKAGFAVSRKEGVSLPPKLDINVLYVHLADVIHYITHAEIARDLNRISRHQLYENMVSEKFGLDIYKRFREFVKFTARPQIGPQDLFDRFLTRWRKLATIYFLCRPTTAIKTAMSYPAGAQEIGWYWALRGSNMLRKHKWELYDHINERSDYMRNTANSFEREASEQLKTIKHFAKKVNIKGKDIGIKEIRDFFLIMLRTGDAIVRYSIWQGAYEKYMSENIDLDSIIREKKAIDYADDIVALTQPSARNMDLSRWQADYGYKRLFNMFMTATLKYGHRTRANWRGWREGEISNKDYFRHIINEQVLPAMLAFTVTGSWAWVMGYGKDDDDESIMKDIIYNQINYQLSAYPILRQIPSSIKYNRPLFETPALDAAGRKHMDTFENFINLWKSDDPINERIQDLAYSLALSIEFESGVPAIKIYGDLMKAYNAHFGE